MPWNFYGIFGVFIFERNHDFIVGLPFSELNDGSVGYAFIFLFRELSFL